MQPSLNAGFLVLVFVVLVLVVLVLVVLADYLRKHFWHVRLEVSPSTPTVSSMRLTTIIGMWSRLRASFSRMGFSSSNLSRAGEEG